MKQLLFSLMLLLVFTYALAWFELIRNKMLTGNWVRDVRLSFHYYLGSVIPYWWLVACIAMVIIVVLF